MQIIRLSTTVGLSVGLAIRSSGSVDIDDFSRNYTYFARGFLADLICLGSLDFAREFPSSLILLLHPESLCHRHLPPVHE